MIVNNKLFNNFISKSAIVNVVNVKSGPAYFMDRGNTLEMLSPIATVKLFFLGTYGKLRCMR